MQCIEVLNRALGLMGNNGDIKEITLLLNEANNLASAIRTDAETFELPYVATDQLFAVFGSLFIPLLVPILKNIVSETKRYKRKLKMD